jgi:hypothetical protein
MSRNEYTVERLANGYILIICRASKLTGLFYNDGRQRHGDLRLSVSQALYLIGGSR